MIMHEQLKFEDHLKQISYIDGVVILSVSEFYTESANISGTR